MPKLTAQEQLDLNLDLVFAIRNHKFQDIESLIAKGADPFAVLKPKDVSKETTDLFVEALRTGKSRTLKIVLDHARKIGKKINLSEHILATHRKEFSETYPLNTFQFASYVGGQAVVAVLNEYAEATGQSTKTIINEPIIYKDSKGVETSRTTFGSLLVRSLTPQLIGANFYTTNKTAKADQFAKEFLASWPARRSDQENLNLEEPVEITWKLPLGNLEALIAYGLDVGLGSEGQTLVSLITSMVGYSKKPTEWAEFVQQGNMRFRNATDISAPEKGADGKVFFYATITNRRGLHPVRFKITLDFAPALELVCKAADPALAAVNKRVGAVEGKVDGVAKTVAEDHEVVENLSERLLDKARAALADKPNALHCFNVIQRSLLAELDAPAFAKTRRFAIKPTTQSAFIAQSAQALLSISLQSTSLPVASLVTGVTGALVNEITQAHARKQMDGVLDATEGLITSKVATRTAVLMTAKAMAAYGENITEAQINTLVAKVRAEVHNLHNLENQAQLTTYLFHESTKHLPVPAVAVAYRSSPTFTPARAAAASRTSSGGSGEVKQIKSHSTGSSPIHSSGSSHHSDGTPKWALAAFNLQGDEDAYYPSRPQAAKKKASIMDLIPGLSCMRPTIS